MSKGKETFKAGCLFDKSLKAITALFNAEGLATDILVDMAKDELGDRIQDRAVKVVASGPDDEIDLSFLGTMATQVVKLTLAIALHAHPLGSAVSIAYAIYVWIDAKERAAEERWQAELAGRLKEHYDRCREKAAQRLADLRAKKLERRDLSNAAQFSEDEAKFITLSWFDPDAKVRRTARYTVVRTAKKFYEDMCQPAIKVDSSTISDATFARIGWNYHAQIGEWTSEFQKRKTGKPAPALSTNVIDGIKRIIDAEEDEPEIPDERPATIEVTLFKTHSMPRK
ncbi:hypothetical protein PUNSTDRAFT_51875 [Punctularia strigosozonata HHB-11173 SS5]|uniref:uncharacterized protein n=1 Tax=Punctularia strigosozonata (strain HHB-11173) TaxID=741275 RepID=UPI0004417D53|nr:uncharacterized protein PUNSTDRAFT_51875 [Punctularia strigosozonata HHB-11173 SS5]EIN09660.1 hypothetical protein PUNSTDRAFT_51875 [Punctularia strigosozonata HHB-11173 SS5]